MLSLCENNGSAIAGRPVRLAKTVKISARYTAIGSSSFLPNKGAVVGATGMMIPS